MFGVSIRPPKPPICPNPVSSRRKMRTFGVPGGGFGVDGHHSSDSS